MSLSENMEIDDFIPSSEPDDYIHPQEYERVCRHRDDYLHALCVCQADMEQGARALFALLQRFRDQMDAPARIQLLDVHALLAYPDAAHNEDMAQIIESINAEMTVDVSDLDTGEVMQEKLALVVLLPGERAQHSRILADIARDGFAVFGDGDTRRRLTESPRASRNEGRHGRQ